VALLAAVRDGRLAPRHTFFQLSIHGAQSPRPGHPTAPDRTRRRPRFPNPRVRQREGHRAAGMTADAARSAGDRRTTGRANSAAPAPGEAKPSGRDDSPPAGESRYRPPAPGRPGPRPPRVRVELVTVDGAEGRQLRATQAEAMWEALRWLHHQRHRPASDSP
jgi:hypothetical protein